MGRVLILLGILLVGSLAWTLSKDDRVGVSVSSGRSDRDANDHSIGAGLRRQSLRDSDSLRVRVRNDSSAPLMGARVSVLRMETMSELRECLRSVDHVGVPDGKMLATDGSGVCEATVSTVACGLLLRVSPPLGRTDLQQQTMWVPVSRISDIVDVKLSRMHTVHGLVLSSSGFPVQGALVTWKVPREEHPIAPSSRGPFCRTDGTGRFTLSLPRERSTEIAATRGRECDGMDGIDDVAHTLIGGRQEFIVLACDDRTSRVAALVGWRLPIRSEGAPGLFASARSPRCSTNEVYIDGDGILSLPDALWRDRASVLVSLAQTGLVYRFDVDPSLPIPQTVEPQVGVDVLGSVEVPDGLPTVYVREVWAEFGGFKIPGRFNVGDDWGFVVKAVPRGDVRAVARLLAGGVWWRASGPSDFSGAVKLKLVEEQR